MKTSKPLFFIFALSTTTLATQAIEPIITQQKQVAGYYHHQIDNTKSLPYLMAQTISIHLCLKA